MSAPGTALCGQCRFLARAIERCGLLIKQIPDGKGKNQNTSAGDHSNVLTRKQAATDSGLSERKRWMARDLADFGTTEAKTVIRYLRCR
jgi:hypothetical protein